MNSEIPFTMISPVVFDGTNYQVWTIRIEAYHDEWSMESCLTRVWKVSPLSNNPTLAQIKTIRIKKQKKKKKSKARASFFTAVSSSIFTRIMTLKTIKAICDFLKKKYEWNKSFKGMQVLNLIWEF